LVSEQDAKGKEGGEKKEQERKRSWQAISTSLPVRLVFSFFCYYCPVRSPTIAPTPKGASDSTQKNEKLKFKKKRRKRQKKKLRASRIPPLSLFLKAFTFLA
jgi:hypothetical protein